VTKKTGENAKPGLHKRNRHRFGYNFEELVGVCFDLKQFVRDNGYGQLSIDFSNPEAVVSLNKALLIKYYAVQQWHLPADNLCPPVPGRADYIHFLADLLSDDSGSGYPVGQSIRALDIGVGANCIYPIVGQAEYGWTFIGSDIDKKSLANAQEIVDRNPGLQKTVELRFQSQPERLFDNILQPEDFIDITLCNPPFHDSAQSAAAGSIRKQSNLSKKSVKSSVLNFGGQNNELWCKGGELSFIKNMIDQSQSYRSQVYFFTSLVSRKAHVPELLKALNRAGVAEKRVVEMQQGNKQSRFIAWTFLNSGQRNQWRENKWTSVINSKKDLKK